MKFWCPNDEMEMKQVVTGDYFVVECPICSLIMKGEILRRPTKTYKQVTLDFNAIPLTDKKAIQAQKRRQVNSQTENDN